MGKPIQLSAKTLKNIAESLFLAYTVEQAAYMAGISEQTLRRIRTTDTWREIERQSHEMEKPYRQKIYRGDPGWQGAAWMLERKYATQFARPDVQLSLNTSTSTTNNTIVITAAQATHLRERNASLTAELDKLTPPGGKPNEVNRLLEPIKHTGPIIPIMSPEHISNDIDKGSKVKKEGNDIVVPSQDPVASQLENKTPVDNVMESAPAAPRRGTPDAPRKLVEPNLPPKSKSVVSSSNSSRNLVEKRSKKRSQGTKARANLEIPTKKPKGLILKMESTKISKKYGNSTAKVGQNDCGAKK